MTEYEEYLENTKRLHTLIRMRRGDGATANRIRERLEELCELLTEEERKTVQDIIRKGK